LFVLLVLLGPDEFLNLGPLEQLINIVVVAHESYWIAGIALLMTKLSRDRLQLFHKGVAWIVARHRLGAVVDDVCHSIMLLRALVASAANPRRKIDHKTIEGLAASIRTDGLLHNLVASLVEGRRKEERFRIVSGERRYHALRLLEDRGELPEGFAVPVEIREDLSKDDTLRIATVENLQRQSLTPLEETAALTKLIHKGVMLDDVVSQTGLSSTTIKRRLVLNSLCKDR
jgi:ParB/RepB/Spo0J family partition protein